MLNLVSVSSFFIASFLFSASSRLFDFWLSFIGSGLGLRNGFLVIVGYWSLRPSWPLLILFCLTFLSTTFIFNAVQSPRASCASYPHRSACFSHSLSARPNANNLVILKDNHWMLYWLVTAMYPQFLITLDENDEEQDVTVRVGQAVNTIGLAGTRSGISGVSVCSLLPLPSCYIRNRIPTPSTSAI